MMESSRALTRKILCALLAAGVVGVSGSALAKFSYGYQVGTDTEDINTKFADGVISGFDYGIDSSNNGNISYKLPNIKIEANVNSLYASKNGNITIGDKKSTINLILKERLNKEHNVLSNNGRIEVLGASINIDSQSEIGGVNSITAKSDGTIGIGNVDTEKVSINTHGSGATNSIVNFCKSAKVNVNAANIEVLTKNDASGNTIGIYNYANGLITMGSGITEQITINTVAGGNANMAYGLYNNQKGNIEINSSKLNLKSSANGNSYGIYGGAKNEINIKNASIVSVEAESSSKNAYAVWGRYGKTSIQADTINLTAKSNTDNDEYQASAVFSSLKYNVDLVGKDINLYAKGAVAQTVGVQGRSDDNNGAVYNINGDNINITAEGSKNAYALNVIDKSNVALGNSNSNINIRSNAKDAYGIVGMTGGTANVNGQSLKIDVTSDSGSAEAIHVQNNTEDATDNFATVNVNTAKTVINAKTGIAAYSQGVVNMNNGDVEINAEKAIETRGNAVTNINQDGSHTVKINGDIDFNVTNDGNSGLNADAKVNINLNNADSYLNGKVNKSLEGESSSVEMNVTGMTMGISNGAAWNMTGDSFVNNADVSNGGSINVQKGASEFKADNLKLDNANINLQGNDQKVMVQKLSGDNGTVNTDSLKNHVTIGEDKTSNLTVNGTKEVTDAIASGNASLQDLADVVKSNDKSAADSVTSDANDIIGGYSAEVDSNGKVVVNTVKTIENTTNRAISDMANISLMTWRQENNDMNKRLGELRDSEGEHGAWARMARGESKYGSQNVKNQYNYYQVGYDEKLSTDPNWTVGVALTRTEGNSTFARGTGENKHTGLAIYGSYLSDNGRFVDLIARYARMDNDYSTIGAGVGDASYETNGYSLSAEYGKRFTKDNGFWIEPQVELTYGTVGSVDYLTSKGARVHQDNVDSLVGRLGFSLGKDIKQGNVYVRASYLYDFDGETKATMSGAGTASFEQDLGGGWWEVGVGTNLNLSDATHLYFDVEKTYGGNVATPWQWNAGVRWSF